ncbi:MAG: hypothetical protein QNI99_16035 [Woeseiaceae bacterium]|nr:hypothetical protein [Woeseiaceae bacterium]
MSVFDELKRRRVYRAAAAYLVVGWLLTEVLTTLLPEFGAAVWVSRAVMLVFAIGFLPAVAFSWIYDVTPEGIRKDQETGPDGETVRVRLSAGDRLTIGGTVVVVFAIGIGGAWWTAEPEERVAAPVSAASVAVLPFANMSADPDNAYFSDGLTETILHMLAQVPDLQVAARTSSFAFRNQDKTIAEIAEALGVAHVLEGSVQRSGDQVRVTAQLIRAEDGFHVWSRNYDLTIDDIFSVQDEIARNVGGALSQELLGDASTTPDVATTNPDAYLLYLQARNLRATFSYSGLREAETLLKAALMIDPDYVDAKVELAVNYWRQFETGAMDQQAAIAEIDAITQQVLDDRPNDPTARAISIFASVFRRTQSEGLPEFEGAIEELEALIAEYPKSLEPKFLLVRFYQGTQQLDKAIELMQGALERDPYNASILYELGTLYADTQEWDRSTEALAASLQIEPAQPNAFVAIGHSALQQGDGVEYLRQYMRAIEVDPFDHELPGLIAALLYQLGLVEEGDDFRKRVVAVAPNSEIAYRLELLRAIATDDIEAGQAAAWRAIEDDVGDRRIAFTGAVHYLLRTAIRQGRVEEELAALEERVPGLLDIASATTRPKYRSAQGAAFDAWYVSMPRDEFLAQLDDILALLDEAGIDAMVNPGTAVAVHAYRGEYEEATDVALERFFTQPVGMNLGWRSSLAQAQFAPLLEDERIKAEIARWEREEEALRTQIRNWLNDLSGNS